MSFIPFFLSKVVAGFPSPADDYIESSLNFHDYVVKHPAATYFVRAQGESMQGAGIMDGDILVIDRSIEPVSQMIVIAAINGELLCKRLDKRKGLLLSENSLYQPIAISDTDDIVIEGVVTHSLTHHVRLG